VARIRHLECAATIAMRFLIKSRESIRIYIHALVNEENDHTHSLPIDMRMPKRFLRYNSAASFGIHIRIIGGAVVASFPSLDDV
jgi:hypothetical protein